MALQKVCISVVAFLIILTFSSCNAVLTTIYGMKSPGNYTPFEILNIGKQYKIDTSECFILQKTYNNYFDSVGALYGYNPNTCDTSQLFKNHYQPLQVLFFDKSGKLVAFQNNCYAGGFPNLRWNRHNTFDSIPAKSVIPIDTLLKFSTLVNFINYPDGDKLNIGVLNDHDYHIAVFWTTFMGRQSKRLIRIIQDKYSNDKNISILYINADCIFGE